MVNLDNFQQGTIYMSHSVDYGKLWSDTESMMAHKIVTYVACIK